VPDATSPLAAGILKSQDFESSVWHWPTGTQSGFLVHRGIHPLGLFLESRHVCLEKR
jgi:hypothetical protein